VDVLISIILTNFKDLMCDSNVTQVDIIVFFFIMNNPFCEDFGRGNLQEADYSSGIS